MYLHLGQGSVVKSSEIIGIFDLDTSTVGKTTRDFLSVAEQEKRVTTVAMEELPKSFVLRKGKKWLKSDILISPLAAATLIKRNEHGRFL